VLITPSI